MTQPTAVPAYWNERLSILIGLLSTELHASPTGTWVGRRLRSGYTVSLTVTDDGTRRCRIASEDRPEKGNAAAWTRFHQTCETMVQHLGISAWRSVAPSLAPSEPYRGALVEFAEPGLAA